MKILFLLQFTSLLSMLINAMLLGLGSLHVRWKNRRYEQSRWMLFAAMLILAAHFLAQMTLSVRASGADLGAVLNLLAYPPSFALIALSIYNIEAVHDNRRRFVAGIVGLYALIVVCYAIGYCCNGSMRIGMWMYVMLALYICLVAYCIYKASRQILLRRKLLETLTASDMLPHVRFAKTSVAVLFVALMTMPFVILFNKILVIYAPVILLAIFFFVLTFNNLGFNYVPTEELVNDDEESARAAGTNGTGSPAAATYNLAALPPERERIVAERLDKWCQDKGYRDSNANMLTLSRMLLIPRAELTRYFEQNLKLSFRIWLSDIRFKAAQEMMRDYPDYSNDIISAECGFSSRTHLYRIFKNRAGCTPTAWRERGCPILPSQTGGSDADGSM